MSFVLELMDFKTRRVAAFRKNLVDLAELELKHAKVCVQTEQIFLICSFGFMRSTIPWTLYRNLVNYVFVLVILVEENMSSLHLFPDMPNLVSNNKYNSNNDKKVIVTNQL